MTAAQPGIRTAAWAPLLHPAFRLVWITFLGVQVANWAETVGAVEVIASKSDSAVLLALVQTAATLPAVLLALPAGAAADLVDRRLLLASLTGTMALSMAVLAILVSAGTATPLIVLALTLVLGVGVAVAVPSFAALIPDLVPRSEMPSAVTLNGISINLARVLGPAFAGLVLAVTGASALFAGLAAAMAVMTLVLLAGPRAAAPPARGQSWRAAMGEGLHFARGSRQLQAVLARGGAFVVPSSALWALLPAVAVQRLDLDAAAFGGLLAAVGVGAIATAQVMPLLRARLGLDLLLRCGTVVGALNLVVLGTVESTPVVVTTMVVAGAAWIAVLSPLQTSAQLAAPAWVRGRALSVTQLVFMGGMAGGSALWGVVAEAAGLTTALLAAAALLAATVPAGRRRPLVSTQNDEQRPGDEQHEAQ